ncbi:MAG: class I SAM-dependent methyltransferase [Chitinophagales bacterium]|nr:class I SAM-dependent methyltransferase [Chitinophagales bacterium]
MIDKNQLGLCGLYLKQWPSYRAAIQFVEENDISKNKKILEIGCSTGFLSAYLRAKGYEVYGIDVSEKAIKEACEKFGPYYSTSMPDDKIFDLVFSCGTIGCVDQPYNFLDKVLSRLSDKGVIFCNAPNKNSMLVDQLWLSTPPPDMISIFAPKTFGIFAEKRGLNLIYKEDKNKILATITYPIQFSSLSATDFLTRMKYIHPLVTIIINTLKNSIRWLLNKFQPSQSLSQYGLFIYLHKK